MNVLIAIDSFKGSLSSLQAGNAVKDAVLRLDNHGDVVVRPLADGGEGTVEALAEGCASEMIELTVTGPVCKPVAAKYCILKDTHTAVIEMASAAGLPLISPEERNPLETTTFGVGELIKDAMGRGCRRFIVGIGGSATNDGGTGMLRALGYDFLDRNNDPIALGAKGLQALHCIKTDRVLPELQDCQFQIACDVTNPLCGEKGCSAVFGPQKGATPAIITYFSHHYKRKCAIIGTWHKFDVIWTKSPTRNLKLPLCGTTNCLWQLAKKGRIAMSLFRQGQRHRLQWRYKNGNCV